MVLLLFMSFLSCEHKEMDPKEHFKQVFNIKAEKLNIDTYRLNSFGRIILNNEGKYVKSFGDYPKDGIENGAKSKRLAYQGWIVYSSLLNRFATVTSSGAIFELYQIDTTPNLIKSYHDIYPVYVNDSSPGVNSIKHGQDNIIGYTDIYATDKYIYALYSGKKIAQRNNDGMMNAMLSNNIFIYNWNGECIYRLISDKKLFNICITDDNKELIALGWDKDFCLYSFDLSKLI